MVAETERRGEKLRTTNLNRQQQNRWKTKYSNEEINPTPKDEEGRKEGVQPGAEKITERVEWRAKAQPGESGGSSEERHSEAKTHQIEKNGQLFAQQCNC